MNLSLACKIPFFIATMDIDESETMFEKIVDGDIVCDYYEAKSFLQTKGVVISTITLDCKLHTLVDIAIFAKHVVLCHGKVLSVAFGDPDDPTTNRSIIVLKKKKKPGKGGFYNQTTILIKPTNSNRNNINIKVFKNGSLQITGCKDMDDFKNVITILIGVLKEGAWADGTYIPFIDNPNNIGIYSVNIRMINSDFRLHYKVDRKKLYKLLKKNHWRNTEDTEIGYVDCKYNPTGGHSCVNIKYRYNENNRPSIFVFETGAIIITGAKTLHQIIQSYKFIKKILAVYYHQIKIIELNSLKVQAEIRKFFNRKLSQK